MYSNIIDPKTNKSVSIRSKKGKRVLRKYLTQVIMSGGAAAAVPWTPAEKTELQFRDEWTAIHPDKHRRVGTIGQGVSNKYIFGKYGNARRLNLAVKEHDTVLYQKLQKTLSETVNKGPLIGNLVQFWNTLITEAYLKILLPFANLQSSSFGNPWTQGKILNFMELLDFMWVRSMYKMWLGGAIDFTSFHEKLFNLVLDPVERWNVDLSGTSGECPEDYKKKHKKACHNTIKWKKVTSNNKVWTTNLLRTKVKIIVGEFIPNIRCACTTIDHFMKAFETWSPKIVGPLVKIFDHLTRDRASHTKDISGRMVYEELCMDFSNTKIPGKVSVHRGARGNQWTVGVAGRVAGRRQSQLAPTMQRQNSDQTLPHKPVSGENVTTAPENLNKFVQLQGKNPLCVKPAEFIEIFTQEEIDARQWLEDSFDHISQTNLQQSLSSDRKLELKQFNNGASIFMNARRNASGGDSCRPITYGMFSAGVSGHTNELSMFIRLFMSEINDGIDILDMTPLIALTGLIWMIELNHHSLREIFLGSMCLSPIGGAWGLPEVIPAAGPQRLGPTPFYTTELELRTKLQGVWPRDPRIIDELSMVYKIISPKDIDSNPTQWSEWTMGSTAASIRGSRPETPVEIANWCSTLQNHTNGQLRSYVWTNYADYKSAPHSIHTSLITKAYDGTKTILNKIYRPRGRQPSVGGPEINTLFDKIIFTNQSLTLPEKDIVEQVVKSSLNAAAMIELLRNNGYDFTLDPKDKKYITIKAKLSVGSDFHPIIHQAWKESAFTQQQEETGKFRTDLFNTGINYDEETQQCALMTTPESCHGIEHDVPIDITNSFWGGILDTTNSTTQKMKLCNWSPNLARGFSKTDIGENTCTPRRLSSKQMDGLEKVTRDRSL